MMKRLSLLLAVMFVVSMMFVAPVFAMGNNDNGDHNNGNVSIVHRNDNGGDHNNNGNSENKDHAKKHGEDRDHNGDNGGNGDNGDNGGNGGRS
jgi:hypothetical protein